MSLSKISLLSLAGPIWIENVLRISLSSVDVFMLSFYSPKAVAGVGLDNQFVFFIQIVYLTVIVGANILISQFLGAGKRRSAGIVSAASLVLTTVFSLVLSLVVALLAAPLLDQYGLEREVRHAAVTFLTIVGGGSIFMALSMALGSIIRAHGFSRLPMYVNIGANILNILGNAVFIFGPFGVPRLGVLGVACSTVFAQAVSCLVMVLMIRSLRGQIKMKRADMRRVPRMVYKKILLVGVPVAGEQLSYNVGQIVVVSMIATLGTEVMDAYIYALTLLRYVFISSLSIGAGTQIKVGYLVGSGEFETAYRKVYRYFLFGFITSLCVVLILNLFKNPLLSIFTADGRIIDIAAAAFLVSMFLEPGRCFNLIIIPALKGSGDVTFPVSMGIVFNWAVGVLGAFIFGIVLKMGLAGIFLGLAFDEWIRGIIMIFRWKSGVWRKKALV